MQWRQSGLVDSPEFKAAKRELLGTTIVCMSFLFTLVGLDMFKASLLRNSRSRGFSKDGSAEESRGPKTCMSFLRVTKIWTQRRLLEMLMLSTMATQVAPQKIMGF